MSKLYCVFSTLAASVEYTHYEAAADQGGMPRATHSVHVKGGAGIAGERLQTPRGVATMVTERDVEMLKRNALFQMHEKNGYVTIDTPSTPPTQDDADNAAAALQGRDNSAPLVPEDYTANGQKPPTVDGAAPRKARK